MFRRHIKRAFCLLLAISLSDTMNDALQKIQNGPFDYAGPYDYIVVQDYGGRMLSNSN